MSREPVEEFHLAFGIEVNDRPRPRVEMQSVHYLRTRLHDEEHRELAEALADGDPAQVVRELADVVYVAYGTALSLGLDLDAAIAEVHRANMDKLGPDGQPILREDGKVLKPPGWQPPDMTLAVRGRAP